MEKLDGVRKGTMTTLQGSSTVESLESKRRIIVRASPSLICTPPVSRVLCDWTTYESPKWSSSITECSCESPDIVGSFAQAQDLCGGYNFAASKEIDVSTLLSGADRKAGCVDDVKNPCGALSGKFPSDLSFCPETTGDAGSVVTPEKNAKKHARYKYDPLIDPKLSPAEKKKQRRILANRASARRSRQKKKEALTHLLRREKELMMERDEARAGLHQQCRINVLLRQQLQTLQSQLAMCQKGKLDAMVPLVYGESDRPVESTDPFLIPVTSDQTCLLDPCDPLIWNQASRL